MQILCIIQSSHGTNVTAFDKSYATLHSVRVGWCVGDKVALYINAPGDIKVLIDYAWMSQEVPAINRCSTWESLEAALDTVLISNYQTTCIIPTLMLTRINAETVKMVKSPVMANPGRRPKVYSCEHNTDIEVSYGTIKNPELDNKKSIRWMLPDIIFDHVNNNSPIVDFNQCIPIINGMAHKPAVSGNRLYAMGATKTIPSTQDKSKGLLLMDFTGLGGMEIVSLNECTYIEDVTNPMIQVPNDVSLAGKSVMMVIAGRLFFPHEVRRISNSHISLELNMLGLTRINVSTAINRSLFLKDTNTYVTTSSIDLDICFISNIEAYIREKLMTHEIQENDVQQLLHLHQDSYLIVINNENVKISQVEPMLHVVKNMLFFPSRTNGLLLRKSTREILDFVKVDYDNCSLITFNHPGNRFMLPLDNIENLSHPVGCTNILPRRYNVCEDIDQTDYLLIDVTDV